MSNFAFLRSDWPAIHEAAARAEAAVYSDPRTACFYARRTLELLVSWVYKSDSSLHLPYQDNLSALLHEPTFKAAVGEAVFMKTQVITRQGNQAVHSHRAIQEIDALTAVRELFHVGYWLAHTYARGPRPAPGLAFDAAAIPKSTGTSKQSADQLQKLEASLREKDRERKALLVMATGAGKTRTVIALCDLLTSCNWAKRVLFLADRVALVNQAVGAFKKHLPSSSPVNLVTEKDGSGRVYVSTYPTMMGLIDATRDEQKRFGVGHFDLIVIDEAHRSVYRKYGAIFDYFDSLLVGLTATPKDEVAFDTYKLFDLERGVPTDEYGLDDAIKDGFLVPPVGVSVPIQFHREGIKYDELSDEEKAEWDEKEWPDEGPPPDRVDAASMNKWLFNEDTVDKVLEHLMTRGQKVAGGDRLGKTIVFAANRLHAEFIEKRFNANYPHLLGAFARVIHHETKYGQSLIDDFSLADKDPSIMLSVDMLDTGIDVPEVVNLVFLKMVRSKTKFWQMVGRGTRLKPDLFGPGKDKEFFYILDYCQNLEFFKQQLKATEGALADSLGKRLFKTRLELIGEIDHPSGHSAVPRKGKAKLPSPEPVDGAAAELRGEVASLLNTEVAAMNLDNFVVRPKRRLVEMYAKPEAWTVLSNESRDELGHEVAGLPSELASEDEEAKRFDLVILKLQLARSSL